MPCWFYGAGGFRWVVLNGLAAIACLSAYPGLSADLTSREGVEIACFATLEGPIEAGDSDKPGYPRWIELRARCEP